MLPNPLKPVIVAEMEDDGENIPKEYRTAATMTMIRMAQPYVIMYSNADWDFLLARIFLSVIYKEMQRHDLCLALDGFKLCLRIVAL
jgi:hypothetical protein